MPGYLDISAIRDNLWWIILLPLSCTCRGQGQAPRCPCVRSRSLSNLEADNDDRTY